MFRADPKKRLGFLQSVCLDAAGKDLAAVRHRRVVGAGETCDRIEQDDYVLTSFDHAAGFFDDHLRGVNVAFGRFVECRADDFTVHLPTEVGHFFRTFVDQKDDQVCFWVILLDRVRHALHEDCLTRAGRCHDEAALAKANRSQTVHDAHGEIVPLAVCVCFHQNTRSRVVRHPFR